MKKDVFTVVAAILLSVVVTTSNAATPDNAPILIKDTGSTNSIGFEFTIYRNRPANCVYNDWARKRPISSRFPHKSGPPEGRSVIPEALVTQLYQDVAAAMPLSKLKERGCMKSISFGSSTFIMYKKEKSPDIKCLSDRSIHLYRDYIEILKALRKH